MPEGHCTSVSSVLPRSFDVSHGQLNGVVAFRHCCRSASVPPVTRGRSYLLQLGSSDPGRVNVVSFFAAFLAFSFQSQHLFWNCCLRTRYSSHAPFTLIAVGKFDSFGRYSSVDKWTSATMTPPPPTTTTTVIGETFLEVAEVNGG